MITEKEEIELERQAKRITDRFYNNLGIDVNDPNWGGLYHYVLQTLLNVSNRVQPEVSGKLADRYYKEGLRILLYHKQTFLETCKKNETPATYESVEQEIKDIKKILKNYANN